MSFSSLVVNLTETWSWQDRTASAGDLAGPAEGAVASDGSIILAKRVSTAVHNLSLAESSGVDSALSSVVVVKLDGRDGSETWKVEEGDESSGVGEALAVAVGGDGDLVFAGTTGACQNDATDDSLADGGCTFVAVKLSGSDGDKLWRYEDPVNAASESQIIRNADDSSGKILALAVDSSGDALFFVGGASGKLDGATGESIWGGSTESYELHACAIDADDNVVAAGLAVGDGLTVDAGFATKVDGDSGEPIWTWQDDTNEFNEVLLGVALDEEGNAYVAGGEGVAYVDGVQIGNSSVVVKIDGSTGREIWRFSGGPTNGGSIFSSVAVDDATETVIAAGVTGGVWYPLGKSEGQLDFLAVALNATTGQELGHWQGGTSRQDVVDFAGFDSRGGLYLGGYSEGLWAAVSSASSDGSGEVEVSSGGITLVKFEPPGYGAEVDEAWSTTIVGLCVALAMGLLVLLSCCVVEVWRCMKPAAFKAGQDPSSGLQLPNANHSGKSTPDSNSTLSTRGDAPCLTPQSGRSPGQHSIGSSTRPGNRCKEGRSDELSGSRRGILSPASYAAARDRLSRRPTVEETPRRRPTFEFSSSLSSGFLLSPLEENPEADLEQPACVGPSLTGGKPSQLPVEPFEEKVFGAEVARERESKAMNEAPRGGPLASGVVPMVKASGGAAKPGPLAKVLVVGRGRTLSSASLSSSSGLSSLDGDDGAGFTPPKKRLSPRAYTASHSTASFATETSAPPTRLASSSMSDGFYHRSVASTDYSEWSWYAESVCTNRSRLASMNASLSPRKRVGSPKLPRDFAADAVGAEGHQASGTLPPELTSLGERGFSQPTLSYAEGHKASGTLPPELTSPVLAHMADDYRLQRLTQNHAMWDSDAGSVPRDTDVGSEGSDSSGSMF